MANVNVEALHKGRPGPAMKRRTHRVKLAVASASADEVYQDIARIPEVGRGPLRTGRVHRFSWSGGSCYLILRGLTPADGATLRIDTEARERLGVTGREPIDFTITEAGLWGELRWAWTATDPAYRVAAKLGVLGLVLGVVGLLVGLCFGLISIFLALHPSAA